MSWNNKARLSLESLDARIVPNATPVLPDPGPAPPANVNTLPPPAPRSIELIAADLKSLALAFKAQEQAYAKHLQDIRANTDEMVVAQGRIIELMQQIANAKDEDKPALEASLAAFDARLKLLEAEKKSLEETGKRLDTNYAGLQAMLAALQDELKRVNAQLQPPPEVAEILASQANIERTLASLQALATIAPGSNAAGGA